MTPVLRNRNVPYPYTEMKHTFNFTPSTCRKAKGPRNLPLQVKIQDGILIMAIGVETLAWASVQENGGPLEGAQIVDADEFAKDVATEMMREDGDYEAQIESSKWLDKMVDAAAERGSGALAYED